MRGKYSKFLTVLLIIIIAGVIGLLGYVVYNFFSTSGTEKDAADYVQTFTEAADEDGDTNSTTNNSTANLNDIKLEDVTGGSSKTKKQYKGFDVLGTIEIPKISLSYPVLAKVTKKSIEVAVAALYPQNPVLNSKGNVVIIGHNYRNGLFFSNLKKLSNGDKIYITDLNNKKVTYKIYKIFEASDNDTSFYNRDTKGAREITLSTCTDDSKARTIIQAKAEGD